MDRALPLLDDNNRADPGGQTRGAEEAHSHLFDFMQGWLYVFGVGLAGGMVQRRSPAIPIDELDALPA